uniref:hypothetical protein n=1 Tax=uncultured Caulobacter sp. TaxID=158749 RepID=UPI0025D16166
HNLPLPLELLTLEAPVGGIAPFETMLGGRAGIHYPTSTRHGRPPGAGAAFFHDAEMSSVEDDHWRDALGQAFGLVDQHAELVVGDLAGATAELNRLYGGTSAWAHFQCHAIYSKFAKKLQLTRKFEVDEERFRGGGRYLVAVFLNCCRATELSEDVTVPPLENALRGSWSEHFSSVGLVPAVIGPFCSLEDEETVEFGRAFYKALASSEDVYDSFVAARAERLAEGHAAALVYRFLGHTSVQLPFANRQALAA